MLYSDQFIESIPQNPIYSIKEACKQALQEVSDLNNHWTTSELEALEEADVLLEELQAADILPTNYTKPRSAGVSREERARSIRDELISVVENLERLQLEEKRERLASRFRAVIGVSFTYEFSDGDLNRVQTLLNELRQLISETEQFEPSHQQRVLSRLENLQKELHKKVSDLDRFWGLVGDAGVMLEKLGNNAKPIVDRIREVTTIVWKTQGRAEQLSSNSPPPQIGIEPPKEETAEA